MQLRSEEETESRAQGEELIFQMDIEVPVIWV